MLVAAACGTGAANPAAADQVLTLPPLPGGQPPIDPIIVAAANPKVATAPLAAYVWDDAAARTIDRARIIVGDRCMRAYGFSPLPGWQPEGAIPWVGWARYGLWDPAAADLGYLGPVANNGNPAPIRYLDPDATSVYLGMVTQFNGAPVPAGGCQGEEFAQVIQAAGIGNLDPQYVGRLNDEALARATQDRRVVLLTQQWKECVRGAGWDYAGVHAPFE
jgi:hypothetical protein